MSEYWKSTPKYWCKHCKTFVRDTKLEKANHDATPKHQGNLKRFLRDLHRGYEKDEKDKERAKAEVARLNGMTAGGGSGAVASSSSSTSARGPTASLLKPQATPSQRKQQLAQLAEMGVSIPDEFRPDMAMAGEWQVTSERIIESESGQGPEAVALGVRKRIAGEEEEAEVEAKKRRWGSTYRSHPTEEDNGDLDSLLSSTIRHSKGLATKVEVKEEVEVTVKEEIKQEPGTSEVDLEKALSQVYDVQKLVVRREPFEGEALPAVISPMDANLKEQYEQPSAQGVVFRKRKAKNIRQK